MIAAQTVIHFAAGKQYEKYLKIIAGVIILLQFIDPFVSSSGELMEKWQEEMKKAGEQIENRMWQADSKLLQEDAYPMNYAEAVALRKIEEELQDRLQAVVSEQGYDVMDVSVKLDVTDKEALYKEEAGEYGWEFQYVSVRIHANAYGEDKSKEEGYEKQVDEIEIGEIVIGGNDTTVTGYEGGQGTERDRAVQECRQLFAQTLGIPIDKVEVVYDGE